MNINAQKNTTNAQVTTAFHGRMSVTWSGTVQEVWRKGNVLTGNPAPDSSDVTAL